VFCIYKACSRDKDNYPEFDEEEGETPTTGGDKEHLI